MNKIVRFTAILSLVFAFGVNAFAHDTNPPEWRGTSGTTFQKWEFSTDVNPALPEVMNNPYGPATAAITVGAFGSGWLDMLPGLGTQQGYWDLGGQGGTIVLDIHNTPNTAPDTYKMIRVQVTYFIDITQPGDVHVNYGSVQGGYVNKTLVEAISTGGAWWNYYYDFWLFPNPEREIITINSDPRWGTVVDQIVVDTKCVPEPSAIIALLMSAPVAGFLARRKK